MNKFKIGVLGLLMVLYSCGGGNESSNNTENKLEAKGGKNYGGVLKISENEYFKNLFPHSIIDAISHRIASQVYEGLFTFDQKDLSVQKRLCEDYTVSEDGLVYTFKIKKGVKFHDADCFDGGKGRELTAHDVKYCFTLLCTQGRNNQGFSIFDGLLKGANDYYNASVNGKPNFEIEGIKVIDDYTIELTLLSPSSLFTKNLAKPFAFIFPKEAYEKYGLDMRDKCVGTGAFTLSTVENGVSVILKRNSSYHISDEHGNKLPFLDAISVQFIKDKKTELFEFKKGNLDMLYRLPTEDIIEILEATATKNGEYKDFILQRDAEMTTHFLGMLNQNDIFKNKDVRKAFNFAVDREKILDFVLNGEGWGPGNNGITPPVFEGYEIETIQGYSLNVDSARYYLSKAGFPNGKGFPKITLDFNSDGERNTNVANEVVKQLKDHINVEIDINQVPLAQHAENIQAGNSSFFRIAWGADIPTPENFLWVFYGKNVPESLEENSYPNIVRYKNAEFDAAYEAGIKAVTDEEANFHFMKAEKIMMKDAPIIVLWYDEGYRLLQPFIKDLPNNPMQFRDFSTVYFEKTETESAEVK